MTILTTLLYTIIVSTLMCACVVTSFTCSGDDDVAIVDDDVVFDVAIFIVSVVDVVDMIMIDVVVYVGGYCTTD